MDDAPYASSKPPCNSMRPMRTPLSCAIASFLTPAVCGGNTQKALALLQKAARLDPAPDSAETAHIWLALASDAVGQKRDAVREMHAARRLNPERRFVAQVSARITSDQGGEP